MNIRLKCHVFTKYFCVIISLLQGMTADIKWDPRGYILYCPCMGRFGNQADHFLGALAFAKSLDRTLVLPPWRTYKNIPFDEWFQLGPLEEYHRVILAEDFMTDLAPTHWPPEQRQGWCWMLSSDTDRDCKMKEGNPFGPFWDGLNVDFVDDVIYNMGYDYTKIWVDRYPASKYPVMSFKGAPASFPVKEEHVHLQKYLQWSEMMELEALDYINKNFPGDIYVGLHMRNGQDWENACVHAEGRSAFMASPQCLGYTGKGKVTTKMCLPPAEEVLRLTREVVVSSKARVVYVATDRNPMLQELQEHLKDLQVQIFHLDPWLPQVDLAILGMADHFIGNCVSSFTAFVARERKVNKKPTYFWGYS
ncbi:GDP-fucose protein O-fucosyltransferase 1-like isoform X2 [Haliotis cracherodii]|uniref:GDP-fucose protein O-fucosyltransferase 1-like isoform X2 n=1 Tax=Haliotis cracherodii TaxID=6455 RepID=UPI0039ECB031